MVETRRVPSKCASGHRRKSGEDYLFTCRHYSVSGLHCCVYVNVDVAHGLGDKDVWHKAFDFFSDPLQHDYCISFDRGEKGSLYLSGN
jgi:hypothetical protein